MSILTLRFVETKNLLQMSHVSDLTVFCRALNLELPGTVVFDYPTASSLAKFCAQEIGNLAPKLPHLPQTVSKLNPPSSNTICMALNSFSTRFCAPQPEIPGDGFSLSVAPHGRWDADSNISVQKLGARFGR